MIHRAGARFVYPVFVVAPDGPVEVHIDGAMTKTSRVDVDGVTYVLGAIADLASIERTPSEVRLHVRGVVDVEEERLLGLDGELTAVLEFVTKRAGRRHAELAALVAGRYARRLEDDVAPVLAAIWDAAKGRPIEDAQRGRLGKTIDAARSSVDPDRTFATEVHRALDVLDACLRGSLREIVTAVLAASTSGVAARMPDVMVRLEARRHEVGVRAAKHWLSVLARSLEYLPDPDPAAIDILFLAFRPADAPSVPEAGKASKWPARPASSPVPVRTPPVDWPFRFPVLARSDRSLVLRVEAPGTSIELDVPPKWRAWVACSLDRLDVRRTDADVLVRSPHPVGVIGPGSALLVEQIVPYLKTLHRTWGAKRVTAMHRAAFVALIAARHASLFEDELGEQITTPLWSAAFGEPLDAPAVGRAKTALARRIELVDRNDADGDHVRLACKLMDRALDQIPAAAVTALELRERTNPMTSEAVQAEARWLDALESVLLRLEVVDRNAVDALACALCSTGYPVSLPLAAKIGREPTAPAGMVRSGRTTGASGRRPRPFVLPVVAGASSRVVLRVEAKTPWPAIEVLPKHVAYVTGSLDDLLEVECRPDEVRVRLGNEGHHAVTAPAPPLVEDDLDAFVRHVAATRHPITFAALVSARHIQSVRDLRAHEIAWRLWMAALEEAASPAMPPSLPAVVDTMYAGRGGRPGELNEKNVLGTAIRESTKTLVLCALGASTGIANLGGGSDEQFARRIAAALGTHPSPEKHWLSMVTGALALLDDHSPEAVRVLAKALGFSLERPVPPPPKPRPAYPRPSNPPRVFETTFRGATLRLIETAGGNSPRYRIELGGERRRVRVRAVVMDIRKPADESYDWIEDDDAELPSLVECLRSTATQRTEEADRLALTLTTGDPPNGGYSTTTATVSVDESGVVEVDMMHGSWPVVDPDALF